MISGKAAKISISSKIVSNKREKRKKKMDSSNQEKGEKKLNKVKTCLIPFALEENPKNLIINTSTPSIPSKEELINQAFKFHSQGNIPEAAKYYQHFINQGFDDHRVFSNYGIILKNLGKLKEAEYLYRKAIELNPNYAEAYSNLGNILRDLGKLKEAELYTRKAIELKPNYAEAYSNLGNILKDLGKLKEAKLSLQKAIELKPNYAEAHSNLGNILKDLGKLKEAELSLQKAIELKPDYLNAYFKLAYLFQSRGNYKKSNDTLRHILSLNATNINQKFKVLGQLHLNSVIEGKFNQFDQFDQIMNYAKQLKKKEKQFIENDFTMKLSLELKDQQETNNYKNLTHIGDSHCMSFSHQTTILKSKNRKLIPVYIRGAKAWHFAKQEMNKWKASFSEQIKQYKYSDELFISFGEIDCRKEEGILPYSIKYNKEIIEVCQITINGYLNYMESHLKSLYSNKYYFGIPAPVGAKVDKDKLDIKRIELIRVYNALLKKEVLSRGSFFIDVYELTVDKKGENNILHMCDDIHLSPRCLDILFKNHLYQP